MLVRNPAWLSLDLAYPRRRKPGPSFAGSMNILRNLFSSAEMSWLEESKTLL